MALLLLALRTALTAALALLPELLLVAGPSLALAPPTQGASAVTIRVGGMGCEACQAHVRSILQVFFLVHKSYRLV